MTSPDRTQKLLLELAHPAEPRTRAEQLEHALRTALALTEADAAVVVTPGSRRAERRVLHAGSDALALVPSPDKEGAARTLAESGQPLLVADLSEDARLAAADACPGVEAGPVLFVALRHRDPATGYVAVYRRRGRARFGSQDARFLLLLSAWLSTTLETLRLASGAEKLTLTDDLTEVYNARFLKTALKREMRRAGRFRHELSVVLVDLDQLAAHREEHGELHASLVLKDLAALLAQQVRSFDLLARFGKDAFVLVLPETPRSGAVEVAERVRGAIERHGFAGGAAGSFTASLGVASYPQEGTDTPALLGSVERALGLARERGTNCVETVVRRAA